MATSKYGIKIKNFQAGSIYQCNLGIRENYDFTKAMFTNNLLLYYLLDNGLQVHNGNTKDIICINFDYGSRSFDEEMNYLDFKIKNKDGKYTDDQVEKFKQVKDKAIANKDLFDKKSAQQIREIFYTQGTNIKYTTRNRQGNIVDEKVIHYKMFYRSTGKAKDGSCMFICDELYDKAINFIRMGIELPQKNAPIVEMSAYSSLISSSIVDTIRINPKNILVLKDVDSFFETNIVSIEINDKKECIAVPKEKYKLKNTMFDGQSLVDESIFPSWAEGYILLRHHMFKTAGFKARIQTFFKDYFGDDYNNAKVTDMFGVEHYVKDIEVITTDNACKFLKFGISYDYWCNKVFENNCMFGIVKTAHKSKLGEVQKMSYQMINSLDVSAMPSVILKSKNYIELLKSDNNVFLEYLKNNQNFSNDFEVLIALCEQNWDFTKSQYFRDRKAMIIDAYINTFKFGKVIQDADNLVFVGSPYAMLLHSVGDSVENDDTLVQEQGAIQCFTTRFADGEYLACFRSPHNSRNNISYLHNVYNDKMFKYFDLGEQIIALNVNHTDLQDRMNGCDFDSDSGYTTNQPDIVECARKAYLEYPTIVNNVPKDTNHYNNTLLEFAKIDNRLAELQLAIGASSNLAQIAQTYMYNFDDQKYKDYVCILSAISQIAIDSSKRCFDIDINNEIDRIQKDLNIKNNGYPVFWKHIKDLKNKSKPFDTSKINYELICPMNYLMNTTFKKHRSFERTLPMSDFFVKFELEEDRRKSAKVEKLIEKYCDDLLELRINCDSFYGDYIYLLQNSTLEVDFEELIEEIKSIYISKTYLGLISWLIDRAFIITPAMKRNKENINTITSKNKSLLLKVLYDINPSGLLKVLGKNTTLG